MSHAHSDGPPRSNRLGLITLGLFLGAALALFVLVACAYAVLRLADPEAFAWAPTLLDRRIGIAASAALLVACLASAAALRFALAGKTRAIRASLLVALVAGAGVLAVRAVEYPAISRRAGLVRQPADAPAKGTRPAAALAKAAVTQGVAADGKRIFLGTCAGCHAPDGSGVKGQGFNLRESAILKDQNDVALLAFVKVGRQPFDPQSKLHLAMPARGGNPALTDQNLIDAAVYARELVLADPPAPKPTGGAAAPASASADAGSVAAKAAGDQPQMIDGELWLPRSILPAAKPGPSGVAPRVVAMQREGAHARSPGNVRRFFSIVVFLNGLHAIYVLFGVALGAWLLIGASRRGAARPELALASFYWLAITAVGLALMPLLYL